MAGALPYAAIALSVLGTTQSANAQQQAGALAAQQGQAQRSAAEFQATELDQQAGQDRASSQHQAVDARRQATFAESRAQALAAASGGGASDPTVVTNSARITGEGEYSALTALFNGEERARGLETQGNLARFTGQQQQLAGNYRQDAYNSGADVTLMNGATSLYQKYGVPAPTVDQTINNLNGYRGYR